MKRSFLQTAAFSALLFVPIALIGCGGGGGGGGGGSSATPTPRPTATLGPTAPTLTIQLRDTSNLPVDGIVTIGTTVLATTGGQVSLRVIAGTVKITVEVNGVVTSRTTTVASSGTTTFVYLVAPGVTPTPGATATVPPPPF